MGLRLRALCRSAYGSLRRTRVSAVPTEVDLADHWDRSPPNLRDRTERHTREPCVGTYPPHRVELGSPRRRMGHRLVLLGEGLLADPRHTRKDARRCVPAAPIEGSSRHSLVAKSVHRTTLRVTFPEHGGKEPHAGTPEYVPAVPWEDDPRHRRGYSCRRVPRWMRRFRPRLAVAA